MVPRQIAEKIPSGDSHHHRKDVSADRELQRVWNFPQNHSSGWDLFLDRNVEIQEDRAG